MMANYPKPINDLRLTADMERVRSGRTQLFRVKRNQREFLSEDNADVVLQPPERHIYADLVNGVWTWVNGCAECNGQPRDWKTYIECEKHDVCRTCGTPRAQLTEAPWGGKHGWQCKPCASAEHEAEKAKALAAMPEEFVAWDYMGMSEIKCPYCDQAIDSSEYLERLDDSQEVTCPRCDHTFELQGEVTVTWTARRTTEDE